MSSQHPQPEYPLATDVHRLIASENSAGLNDLALHLFKQQFENCAPYRRFATSLGLTPATVTRWQDIPAIPTRAFKLPAYPLSTGSITFLTSGTTTETKGAHHFPATTTYHLAARTHWQKNLPPLPLHFLSPSPAESPHSSLVNMFQHLHQALDPQNTSPFLLYHAKFHLAPLHHLTQPIILAGTALAFLHLLESHQPIPLPSGSQLLETGGYKGTSRTLAKADLYQQLSSFFDVPDTAIHNEYGMTELSSQAYATGSQGTHRFPHWARTQIICPQTETPLPHGQMGYLQIHDLANLHSVAAIRTQDFATAHPDGSFTLHGRDPSALPRGCSRSIDHSLTR
ncbi:MAG: hypothetical protein ACSHYF_16250 [Verrucomicrobiaceae bacterium]